MRSKLGAPEGLYAHHSQRAGSARARALWSRSRAILSTMPGLPKVPAAVNIDVTDDGKIMGLF